VPGPFDTTTRYLVETYPVDWLSFLGFDPAGPVEVVDTNLTAVSAEVDKVVRIGSPRSGRLVHLEFQSSYDPTIGERLLRYNAMLHLESRLAVASVLVLLRPAASGSATSGTYQVALPGDQPYLTFRYAVRRIWQEPSTELLTGPLGTLPLAPLGATRRTALPGLLRAMDQGFEQEATVAEAGRLRVVTYTLLGLRYPPDLADQLMPGIQSMRDSSTYQAIVDEGRAEGRAEGERRLLLLVGESRLGPPDEVTRSKLDGIADADVLERLARRLLTVSSWAELLAGRE
jgi:predicted transposase YdaD